MAEEMKTWTIDNKEYNIDELSDEAKNHIVSLRIVDQEITNLKQKLAIAQTARNAYAKALNEDISDKH